MADRITKVPLMFTFQDAVSGNGFLAGITLSGRALMVREEEDGRWWMYGVRPGAIADAGSTLLETFTNFKERYKLFLFDVAEESKNFEEFKKEVERFFYELDDDQENRWMAAVQAIRSGDVVPEEPFSTLPRIAPERRPAQITVERLSDEARRFKPGDNAIDTYMIPMAA